MLSSAQGRPEEQIGSISPSFLVRWFLEYGSTHLPSRLLVLNVQRLTFQRLYDTLCSGVGVSERQGLPCVHCISPETGTQQLSKPHQVIQPLVPLLPPGEGDKSWLIVTLSCLPITPILLLIPLTNISRAPVLCRAPSRHREFSSEETDKAIVRQGSQSINK